MFKYAKITDPVSKRCDVGIGDPDAIFSRTQDKAGEEVVIFIRDYYQHCGMELMDVEEAHDGSWYVAGYAPAEPVVRLIRTFAKDAIWVATRNMILADGRSVWNAFKEFLISADLWEGWNQQAYLLEDNPFYAEFYPQAVTTFGQELVDQVLASAVVSTRRADV